MSYGIYIIHEKKKAGLASDVDDRLAQQGYTRADKTVEVFQEGIKDLATARMVEKTVQQALGYTKHEQGEDLIDKVLKRRRKKTMSKSFKTFEGNTIGFPMDLENVMSMFTEGCTLETNKGTYNASAGDMQTLFEQGHLRKSKFSGTLKTYIYTKIVDNYFASKPTSKPTTEFELFGLIREWATDKGIMGPKGRIETQTLKLGEEFGELQKAVLKDDKPEITDAIGDICVVLTSIAYFNGTTIEECIQAAYDVISKRTGHTNAKGDFIKVETL